MRIVRHRLESVDSTRRYVRELETPDEGTLVVVTADQQTAGYGQYGRAWQSPIGANLLLTLLFVTDEVELLAPLANATATVLRDSGLPVELIPPNDLFVYGKKIGGVIADRTPLERGQRVALSLGLNVNMTPVECAEIDQPATSLRVETGKFWPIDGVLESILGRYCAS